MKTQLDITSVFGYVLAIAVMYFGATCGMSEGALVFAPGNLSNFFDPPSIVIVILGTFTALMVSFPLSQFLKMPKHMKIVFFPSVYEPTVYINQLVAFARKARINGLLALEEDLATIEDPFLKSSMLMVVDSVDPEKVKQQLESRLDNLSERHSQDAGFYTKAASLAPAFGMIGTLFGLINMLAQLDDPSTIASNMAVALITTLYGSVLSNVIFSPMAVKLIARHEEEYLCDVIICEGVQAIQAGENPRFIREKLISFLPQKERRNFEKGAAKKEKTKKNGKKNKEAG